MLENSSQLPQPVVIAEMLQLSDHLSSESSFRPALTDRCLSCNVDPRTKLRTLCSSTGVRKEHLKQKTVILCFRKSRTDLQVLWMNWKWSQAVCLPLSHQHIFHALKKHRIADGGWKRFLKTSWVQ